MYVTYHPEAGRRIQRNVPFSGEQSQHALRVAFAFLVVATGPSYAADVFSTIFFHIRRPGLRQ